MTILSSLFSVCFVYYRFITLLLLVTLLSPSEWVTSKLTTRLLWLTFGLRLSSENLLVSLAPLKLIGHFNATGSTWSNQARGLFIGSWENLAFPSFFLLHSYFFLSHSCSTSSFFSFLFRLLPLLLASSFTQLLVL